MALFFLQGAVSTLKSGAESLLQTLMPAQDHFRSLRISKQAVSKACHKFPYEAFIALQQEAVNTYYAQAQSPRWMGLRLVGVDGTRLRLPRKPDLAQYYGTQGNQTASSRPMALLVMYYDVLSGIPLSGELSPITMGERFLAERLLAGRCSDDLLLYDRGFPSFAMMALHTQLAVPYCMRLPLNYHPQVRDFVASGEADQVVMFNASPKARRDCEVLEILSDAVKVRLVRVSLPGGQIEVLATSLIDEYRFPTHLFKDLYARRWAVEEGFKALKSWAQVERYRTTGVESVEREVYARLLMLTLTSLVRASAQPRADALNAKRQRTYRINFAALLRKWRQSLASLWLSIECQSILDDFLEWVVEDVERVRPGRSNPRKCRYVNALSNSWA